MTRFILRGTEHTVSEAITESLEDADRNTTGEIERLRERVYAAEKLIGDLVGRLHSHGIFGDDDVSNHLGYEWKVQR